MNKGTAIISILIALLAGFALGHLTGSQSAKSEAEMAAVAEGDDAIERFKVPVSDKQPQKGPDDALVTIVEFSDFECPFCSRVEPTVSRIMNEYRGKVRVVWRNNPLPFHQNAMPAAVAALEAHAQGGDKKFWKMHELLFQNQRALSRADLEKYGKQAGLDVGKLRQALDGNKYQAAIRADQELAQKLGARGTPAFFINGRKLMGAQPYEEFKTVVDDEIKRAEALVDNGVDRDRVYAELTKNALTEEAGAQPGAAAPAPEQRRQPDPNAVYKVPVGDEPVKGPADALVTIVEFSDFECPFCSRVEPTITQLREQYGKDIRVVWMNNPLPFHENAMPAAIASMEAYKQGGNAKFWKMHELLFQNQRALSRADLEKYGQQVGLNAAKLRQALDTQAYKDVIEKQQNLARQLGATGTPSFFINGRNLRGAQPIDNFKRVIDEELQKAKKLVESGTPRAKVYDTIIKDGATEAKFVGGGAAPSPAARPEPGDDTTKVYDLPVPRNAPRKGPANAKVVIQEFSDFQCPFCSRVLPTVQRVTQEYGNKVSIVWRNYPLPFHQEAGPAAEAALEVFKQGGNEKFWKFHDLLFQNQQALSRADLEKYAQQVGGINMTQFKQALDTNRHRAAVQADMDAVQKAGASIGTPSFFINGRLVQGAQPFEAFKAVIDQELAK